MICIREAIPILGIGGQRIRLLCKQGRIPKARLVGRMWFLPDHPTVTPSLFGPRGKWDTRPPVVDCFTQE